ncbi:nucleotidyltransferase family protein [Ectobacillus funiculus]|uniref:nucleotidyltransferase domain-containing protein n=1 Tax=Ectobacillus funiculus TaxID=137993 RepID=UPI00397A2392
MHNGHHLNLNHVPKELKLQLEIMNRETVEELKAFDEACFANIDWNKFLELAMHHRVYSFIYPKMKEIDEKLIPAYVIQTLQHYFKINTFQMLHLSAEMEQVSKLFTENEIRTLFLKGPVLAADLYGDISLRTSSDLDVLIPLNDLDRAEKLLLKLGYVKDDYILTILNDWKWRHHHVTYSHPQKNIKLEIHWRLHPGPAKEPQFNELWDRKRTSSLTSYPVYLLGREDLFLFLVSHGARHGWSRLRWLVDIHQIVKQGLDWGELNKLLKRYQCRHVAGQALILSLELLKTPFIGEMKASILINSSGRLAQEAIFYLEKMVNLHTDPVPEDVSRYHKRHLFSLMSTQQKLLFIMSFLYPYPEDAEVLPLPKHLHFLYFLLRPVLWAWRKTRKSVVS